jgi:hypothetical protein
MQCRACMSVLVLCFALLQSLQCMWCAMLAFFFNQGCQPTWHVACIQCCLGARSFCHLAVVWMWRYMC